MSRNRAWEIQRSISSVMVSAAKGKWVERAHMYRITDPIVDLFGRVVGSLNIQMDPLFVDPFVFGDGNET